MLARREAAKLSQNLDSSSDKVEFRIVDPPVQPLHPSSPNRPLLLTAVLILGVGAGIAVPLLLAQLGESFSTVRALREAVAQPVLGSISAVLSPRERRRTVAGAGAFLACVGVLLLAYGAVVIVFLRDSAWLSLVNSLVQPVRDLI
jgi:hypothetical protein